MWWLQQQSGQQQRGQLYRVHAVVRVVAAVLVRAIGRGSEAAERSFGGLVSVGRPCSQRVILPSSQGSFSPPPQRIRTFGRFDDTAVVRCARTCAVAVAAWPL